LCKPHATVVDKAIDNTWDFKNLKAARNMNLAMANSLKQRLAK